MSRVGWTGPRLEHGAGKKAGSCLPENVTVEEDWE
jgi:hypothetical protein